MTDIAMTAEAAPAPQAAPEEIVSPPNPIRDEPHEAEAKPEVKAEPVAEKKLSAREALEAAAKKVDADEKAEGDKTKPEVKAAEKPRDDTGKFAAKAKEGEPVKTETQPKDEGQPAPHHEAPARFSTDAKAKWETVDESIKAETHRAIRELEQGHAKYKQAASDYEAFRPFHELAKSVGADPVRALEEYVGIDKLLGQDLVAGLERICNNKGVSLRDVAAHVMGQQAQQQPGQPGARQQPEPVHPQVQQLEQQVAMLAHQLQQVTGTVSSGIEKQVSDEVSAFASDKPLFDELSEQIAAHIANDGLSLQDAYDKALSDAQALAQRLGFIPKAQAAPAAADVDLEAQTQKGRKSIAGAPSAGSAPATHKPSPSIKDAIRKAMQASAGV